MNRPILYLLFVLALSSCGYSNFMQDIQGKWKVTEVNYIFDTSTSTYYPTSQYFDFDHYSYQFLQGDTLSESGSFEVNPKATQITFHSALGNSTYNILEKSANNQHWRSKNKIIDLYLDFKLEKIE